MRAWFSRRRPAVPEAVKRNIQSIAQLEQELARRRTPVDRISDAITRFAGSIWFVLAHLVWFTSWIVVNTLHVPGVPAFDPYPFSLLGVAVALEAIFLTMFVLMSQNRQSRLSDQWAHVDLQIGLLAEQESTKMLQMLQRISSHLGLEKEAHDTELKELAEKTHLPTLIQELEKARTVEAELIQEAARVREAENALAQEMARLKEREAAAPPPDTPGTG